MIEEMIESPEEELKRADHLIQVSLKISRTCDVMKNAIERLISTYEMSFDEMLELLENKRKISEIPKSPKQRVKKLKDFLGKTQFNKYIRHYNSMKEISGAECTSIGEFRKGLTLIANGKKEIRVDMEKLKEWFRITKEARKFMTEWMKGQ